VGSSRAPSTTGPTSSTDSGCPTALDTRQLGRATRRLRLTNDDGTPTAWWAFLNIVAPSLVMLSIIAGAIIRS